MCGPAAGMMSSGIGMAGQMAGAMGQQAAARKQDQANKDHALYQLLLMNEQIKKQEANRRQGEAMWNATLNDMSAGASIARQTHEARRLASYLNGDSGPLENVYKPPSLGINWWEDQPTSGIHGGIHDYTNGKAPDMSVTPPPSTDGGFSFGTGIAGSKQGGGVFQADLAAKTARAARGARKEINALAGLSSYGGSYGGLGSVNPLLLQNSGNAIDFRNNLRKGDMQVYNVQRQIPATQYKYRQSPMAGLGGMVGKGMSSLGQSMGGGGGLGGIFGGF